MSAVSGHLEEALTDLAARRLGFARPRIDARLVRRLAAVELEQSHPSELLERARAGEPRLVLALERAITVGETFFFRQPGQFDWISRAFAGRTGPLRALSAGCSSGEEAYSIAACLLDCAPKARVEVVGVDIDVDRLQLAEWGVYGAWSLREPRSQNPALCEPLGGDRVQVVEAVRRSTRFLEHNLLEPLEAGGFDLVLCRNVLIYLTAEAAAQVTAHLAAALSPTGLLMLGTVEADRPPPGLTRVGDPELQIFQRSPPAPRPRPPSGPAASPHVERAGPGLAVRLHLLALERAEAGELGEAEQLLEQLERSAPDYLPGLLERGLLAARLGRTRTALRLMRALLMRLEPLADEALVEGPEPRPARYYRVTAEAFLSRGGGR